MGIIYMIRAYIMWDKPRRNAFWEECWFG